MKSVNWIKNSYPTTLWFLRILGAWIIPIHSKSLPTSSTEYVSLQDSGWSLQDVQVLVPTPSAKTCIGNLHASVVIFKAKLAFSCQFQGGYQKTENKQWEMEKQPFEDLAPIRNGHCPLPLVMRVFREGKRTFRPSKNAMHLGKPQLNNHFERRAKSMQLVLWESRNRKTMRAPIAPVP